MAFNRGLNICDGCYEYREDCTCGQYNEEDMMWEEADRWIDEQKEEDSCK